MNDKSLEAKTQKGENAKRQKGENEKRQKGKNAKWQKGKNAIRRDFNRENARYLQRKREIENLPFSRFRIKYLVFFVLGISLFRIFVLVIIGRKRENARMAASGFHTVELHDG